MDIKAHLHYISAKQRKKQEEREQRHRDVKNDPTKGMKDGRCNRTDCQTGAPATQQHLYNSNDTHTGNAYYCTKCAHEIAHACRHDGFQLFGFMPEETRD